MPLKKNDIEKALNQKGFIKDQKNRDHIYYVYITTDGKKSSIFTYYSHSSKNEIDDYLTKCMARQCRLRITEFKELIKCPLKQIDYEKILIDNGHI